MYDLESLVGKNIKIFLLSIKMNKSQVLDRIEHEPF